jgi:uncharacterized phage protein (TIGR01671 family)
MRKIKFRAWEKSVRGLDARGMMWQSDETFKDYVVGFDGSVFEKFMDSFAGQSFDNYRDVSDRFVLMQYTGLKGKNGREIYEGDVVRNGNSRGAVEYLGSKFLAMDLTDNHGCNLLDEDAEVIGNIHEDPELLK